MARRDRAVLGARRDRPGSHPVTKAGANRIGVTGGIWTTADVDHLVDAGITHVVCAAQEMDALSVRLAGDRLAVLPDGMDDDGLPTSPSWFGRIVTFSLEALRDPDARLLPLRGRHRPGSVGGRCGPAGARPLARRRVRGDGDRRPGSGRGGRPGLSRARGPAIPDPTARRVGRARSGRSSPRLAQRRGPASASCHRAQPRRPGPRRRRPRSRTDARRNPWGPGSDADPGGAGSGPHADVTGQDLQAGQRGRGTGTPAIANAILDVTTATDGPLLWEEGAAPCSARTRGDTKGRRRDRHDASGSVARSGRRPR